MPKKESILTKLRRYRTDLRMEKYRGKGLTTLEEEQLAFVESFIAEVENKQKGKAKFQTDLSISNYAREQYQKYLDFKHDKDERIAEEMLNVATAIQSVNEEVNILQLSDVVDDEDNIIRLNILRSLKQMKHKDRFKLMNDFKKGEGKDKILSTINKSLLENSRGSEKFPEGKVKRITFEILGD